MLVAFTHNSKLAASAPSWGSVDKTALPDVAFARHRSAGEPKGALGYPHHWVQGGKKKNSDGQWTDGTLYLHKGGLNAAWAAANGAHTGKNAEPAVLAHLRKHFKALGIKQAALAKMFPDIDIKAVDRMLVGAGLVSEAEINPSFADRIRSILR